LERVARAIFADGWRDGWEGEAAWEKANEVTRTIARSAARAALQALLQPDEGTVEAMAIALSLADPDERGLPAGEEMATFYRQLARPAFTAAINSILGEEEHG
jgi:hypothetical protein